MRTLSAVAKTMQKTPPGLITLDDHRPYLGTDYIDFLRHLPGPVRIDLKGEDSTRCRAIVTLLHGNEPSGVKALHRLLQDSLRPATDVIIIIASVNAAMHPPLLSHRFLPWETDLNRCFKPPYASDQGRLAKAILSALTERPLEAVIDAHNTSAHSEPFTVSVMDTDPLRQLSSAFASHHVIMDQRLGTLLDHGTVETPYLTVEFGGLMDPNADRLAYDSLGAYLTEPVLYDLGSGQLNTIRHPLRLEISAQARLHYSASVVHNSHVTMFNTIDQLNFQRVPESTPLGWLSPEGLDHFRIRSGTGMEDISVFFSSQEGFLTTVRPITLFMATTDPYIAVKDCLLYLTPHD